MLEAEQLHEAPRQDMHGRTDDNCQQPKGWRQASPWGSRNSSGTGSRR